MTDSRKPDDDKLKNKWVYNFSRKPLTSAEMSLLQRGPKFAISSSSTPIIDYTTATNHICDSVGENNLFGKTDCTEYYATVKDVLTNFTAKPKHILPNITKEERKTYTTLEKITSIWILLQVKELPWSL